LVELKSPRSSVDRAAVS